MESAVAVPEHIPSHLVFDFDRFRAPETKRCPHRSIIDLYRRREVRDRALERLQAELAEQPDAAAERVLCQCVKRLLPGLPEKYRDVLQRIDLDGLSPKEVASALGLTTGNLTVRLHRARHRLRAGLQKSCKVCSKHGCLDCTCDSKDRDRGETQ